MSIFDNCQKLLNRGLTRIYGDEVIFIHDSNYYSCVATFNPSFFVQEIDSNGIPILTQKVVFEFQTSSLGSAPIPATKDLITRSSEAWQIVEVQKLSTDWIRCFVHTYEPETPVDTEE